jgi:hypothetical protein
MTAGAAAQTTVTNSNNGTTNAVPVYTGTATLGNSPISVSGGNVGDADEIPVAMAGVVPTKLTAENGLIRRGDLLVTSSTPGCAMKGTDRNRMLGAVIGKTMGPLDAGTGVIEVLVTLQ